MIPADDEISDFASAYQEMLRERPDEARALQFLRKAHESGDARASYALGTWYLYGKDQLVNQDWDEAFRLLAIAAAKNIPAALYDLGVAHEKGEVGNVDLTMAFEYYLKAAIRGDRDAIAKVGAFYREHRAVPDQDRLAEIWLERAAEDD